MMTKSDPLLARCGARILAALLVATMATIVGCSGSDKPPPGGGSATTTSGGIPGSGEGVAADSGRGDGSTVAQRVCQAAPNTAPMFPITFDTAAGPPPLGGGVIIDGTYFETSEVRYAQASALPPIMSGGVTFVIAGMNASFGRYTTEKTYVSTTAIFTIDHATGGALDGGDAGAVGADTVVFNETCPAAGSSVGPQHYAVSGNDLTISFGTYTVTYTKQ